MEPPGRREIDAAATALVARHGAQILATARRYAATPEDAEDAYQRGLEILLRKAPTTRECELVPWLKTVVKHEAFALRRQRDRHTPLTDDGDLRDRPTPAKITHDRAEQYERLRQGGRGARAAQAPGDQSAAAQSGGLLLPRDLPAHRLDVHEGEPLPDRGATGTRSAARRDRERD